MYLNWEEKTISDFSDENINKLYDQGFVFTRKGKGVMNQTRSVRVDLDKFELSSENKRILRKTENLELKTENLPYGKYSWEIGKLGKDFYETKFGKGIFSANKIKELLTDEKKSNFNVLFVYCHSELAELDSESQKTLKQVRGDNCIGYAICYENNDILHYSYPFYSLLPTYYSLGLGMMTKAVEYAKKHEKKYIYLGSASTAKALYKFQFRGIEWFDKDLGWSEDLKKIKELL